MPSADQSDIVYDVASSLVHYFAKSKIIEEKITTETVFKKYAILLVY